MMRPLSAPRSTAATLRVAMFLSLFLTSAWIRGRDATVDIEDIAGTLGRARRRREERHRLGNILRNYIDPQRRPLAVHLLQLVRRHTVGCCALLPPGAVPDARTGQHSIGIDGIDANAELPALFRQATRQVHFSSLGRRIRSGILAGDQRVLAGHKDQVAPAPLSLQEPEALARHQEIAGG